jgi:nucleoside-diphosphate-sugar epimerase
MMVQKVLVTGGSGRLGRFVVDEFKGRADVTVMDIRPPVQKDVSFIEGSVLGLDFLRSNFSGFDAVVHLAAIPNPRTAPPDVTFNTNVQGTWNVLQAAEDAGVKRTVVISSDAATGLHYNPKDWGPRYLPIDEKHPLRPIEFYSLSKEVTEVMCRCYANRGKMEVVVIRPTHIVFEPEWPELKDRGDDLQNYHLWAYVEPQDVAQAIRLATQKPGLKYDTFLVAAADSLGDAPTVQRARERWGAEAPEIRDAALFEDNPRAGVFDISHAREVLGYEPRSDWRKMFAAGGARKSA